MSKPQGAGVSCCVCVNSIFYVRISLIFRSIRFIYPYYTAACKSTSETILRPSLISYLYINVPTVYLELLLDFYNENVMYLQRYAN